MTLKCGFQGHLRSNVRTDLNSQHMVSCLLPIQCGHLSVTVWPQHAIYQCEQCPKMDDLDCMFQGQLRTKVKTDLNSQHVVCYLLPMQYGHLSLSVWPQLVIYQFPRMDDLDYKFQGQLRSKVKTDLNSQHMVCHLLPTLISDRLATTRHLSLFPKMNDLE